MYIRKKIEQILIVGYSSPQNNKNKKNNKNKMASFEEQLDEYMEFRMASNRGEYLDLDEMRRFWALSRVPGIRETAWRIFIAEAEANAKEAEEEEWEAAIELAVKAEGEIVVCACCDYNECEECRERDYGDYNPDDGECDYEAAFNMYGYC